MGSAALKDPEFVKDMAREFPGGIVVAVDAKDGMVATEGWAETSEITALDLARRFEDAGVAAIILVLAFVPEGADLARWTQLAASYRVLFGIRLLPDRMLLRPMVPPAYSGERTLRGLRSSCHALLPVLSA